MQSLKTADHFIEIAIDLEVLIDLYAIPPDR
jgi:hypothetical protein